ncbi:MAG TPA: (2Fe-2S) ferredoxin domain-containing protein [Chryseolinea sp.]
MKHFSRPPECVLYVCCGSKCKKSGGKHLYKQLKSEVKHRHLKRQVQVIKTGCTDRCKMGPIVAVMPKNEWHLQVSEEMAAGLIHEYSTPRHPKA